MNSFVSTTLYISLKVVRKKFHAYMCTGVVCTDVCPIKMHTPIHTPVKAKGPCLVSASITFYYCSPCYFLDKSVTDRGVQVSATVVGQETHRGHLSPPLTFSPIFINVDDSNTNINLMMLCLQKKEFNHLRFS